MRLNPPAEQPPVTIQSLNAKKGNPLAIETRAQVRRANAEARLQEAHADGVRDYYKLRREWSPYLKWLISLATLFQASFIWCVGLGWLPFPNHDTFLNIVSGELFIQVLGLGYIAARCLYPSKHETASMSKIAADIKSDQV
ncbi:MAG: hypothetical protein KF824_10155 [Fimbriimonadaceae bacterium]|nr:MAG: hypothetical protein KF824_10155 [Fimbriimonadaceae bacterium]